jgi:hypothetical protein
VSDVDTDIEKTGDGVLVQITTAEKQSVKDLQQRAVTMGDLKNYRPGVAEFDASNTAQEAPAASTRGAEPNPPTSPPKAIPLSDVAVQNIDDGVRISFVTTLDQRDTLRELVSKDADRLAAGDCQSSTPERRVTSN